MVNSNIDNLASKNGTPLWKHSELFFEKKQFIPAVQQLLASYGDKTIYESSSPSR
jgi:hypothetical protein